MARVLMAWLGDKDLAAAKDGKDAMAAPVARALASLPFDHGVLLNDRPKERAREYERWLRPKTKAKVIVRQVELSSPTDYAEIYETVTAAVRWARETYGDGAKLTFHLSAGTPAMTAIWIILAKTRVDAELVEASEKRGITPVHFPFDLAAEFIPTAVQRANVARLADPQRPEDPTFGDILHRSSVMKRLVRLARQAAAFSEAIYVEGDSGTGKQLLAEAIHGESPRRARRFVEVNCGAIPENLFESSFFGHKKGSFTGADRDAKGYFEEAHGGTLFLDEVGELPLAQQVKLLRALQQKKVRPVGGSADVPVDVRVIAATNRNLLDAVRQGTFREDLYFRLAVLVLKVPPLREREGDVNYLIDALFAKIAAENATRPGGAKKTLSVGARSRLQRHTWPGNVRELESTLRRAYVWSEGATIRDDEVRDALLVTPDTLAPDVLGQPFGEGFSLNEVLHRVAHHYLARAMKESGGSLTKAAALLGFGSYQTLKGWLRKHDVEG